MSEQQNSLRTIFVEALEIEDVEQRAAFLAQACGADSALRREVEELIQAHAAVGRFLPEQPAVTGAREALLSTARSLGPGGAASIVPVSESPGDRIGRYKLLQQIGEGGCGVVYMAEQEEPVRRRVALKVIKLGMDTKQVVARFEAERQALALMEHPNIAKVFDAGATETGRPYFVMELVRGTKITEYCDENELSTRERLDLFIQVCLAVQHAHQKGIIHRDLKPSNILVTVNDAKPVPKVIDFGIAKATEGRLTDHTLFTAFDQFLGTPAYMSPEQTVMTSQDIDTRSDIYSLGVLLYELLTGKTPFDTRELMAVGMDELRRTIQEKEPMRPSTRLKAMLHEELTTTARHRHSEPPKLIHLLHGDLDWIVMKCLEKDRTRRYETANGLTTDIQRHLNCQPVVARPPSRLYEFQKTVRRHKVGFTAAAVVIASLTAGVLFSAWQAVLARRAEREQGRLRVIAEAAQQRSRQEAEHARVAEMDAREKLRASYLAQAKAERWSRRAGRRFEGLEVLKRATEIRPGLDLRNEAIACMALPDFRLEKELDYRPAFRGAITLDSTEERYAVCDERGNVYVRAIADNRELALLRGFGVNTRGMAFIPDSRLIAVGYDIPHHGELRIWDWAQTNVVLRPPVEDLAGFVFSPDGRHAAIAQIGRLSLVVYDIERGRVLRSVPQTSQVSGLAFDPAGERLAFGNDESSLVQVLDVEAGALESLTNSSPAYALAWNAEGSLLATGCYDGRICIWDTISGKNRATIAGHQSAVIQVSFNKAGDLLLSTSWDGTMGLWSAVTGTEICSRPIYGYLAWFADVDRRLLCLTGDGKLGVFEMASGRECRWLPFDEKSARSSGCTFSPDGQVLVSAHKEGLRFWDPNRGRQIRFEPIGDTRTAVFHPSGKNLITNGRDGLRRWPIEISPGAALHELKMGPAEELHWSTDLNQSISFDHEKSVAAAVRDGRGYLFDLNTRAKKGNLVPDAPLRFVALSGDAQRCAVGNWESKSLRAYDVESGSLLTDLPADNLHIAAFSPDSRWLVGGGYFEFSFWSTASWQSVGKLRRQSVGYVDTAIAFLPNSRMVALADANWIRLVEPATGREVATLESPVLGNVLSLAFSPDGTRLAACGWNHSIQLWDLRLIRQQLASMNLDWELPSYPDSAGQPASK